MHKWILLLGAAAFVSPVWAVDTADDSQFQDAEGRTVLRITAPKGVTFSPAEKVEVDKANEALKRAYLLLGKEHNPTAAMAEMNKALAVMDKIGGFKLQVMNAGQGAANVNVAGTPHDEIEIANALAVLREIQQKGGGQAAAANVDNGLQKRKLLHLGREKAHEAQEEQDQLNQDVDQMAAGGGQQQPQNQNNKPPKPQNNKAQQQPGGGQQQPQENPNNQANQPNQGAEQQANANNQNQPNPNNPDQNNPNPNNPNQTPDQNNPNNPAQANQNPNNPNQPNQGGGQTQPQAPQNPTNSSPTGQSSAAQRQDEIAKKLGEIAANLPQGTGPNDQGRDAADKFRKAAGLADENAKALAKGDMRGAADRGREVAKAIREALAAAGAMDEAAMAKDVADLEGRAAQARNDQEDILKQTQRLGNGQGAGTPNDKQKALADAERGLRDDVRNLKKDIANTAAALGDLAKNGERSAAQAAAANMNMAAAALEKGAEQGIVNATVAMQRGDTDTAMRAMAGVRNQVEDARGRIAAAGAAIAGTKEKQAEAVLNELKNAAGAMNQVKDQANANNGRSDNNAGAQANPDSKDPAKGDQPATNPAKGDQPTTSPAKGTDPAKAPPASNPAANSTNSSQKGTGAASPNPQTDSQTGTGAPTATDPIKNANAPTDWQNNPQAANQPPEKPGQVPASLAKVMNDNVRNTQATLAQVQQMVQQTNPELARQIFDEKFQKALKEEVSFERDLAGSLRKVEGILSTLNAAAAQLEPLVGKEAEKRALREYTAEPVPLPYRGPVENYFWGLSADPSKTKDQPK